MPADPIYFGGPNIGGEPFIVDGNMTVPWPCSLPRISFPFEGDSIFDYRPIAATLFDGSPPLGFRYALFPYGTYPNIQPYSYNQQSFILEQDFMVAEGFWQPLALNSPYNFAWTAGWTADAIVPLANLVLVREGPLEDRGGGICKFTRIWASLPPTRNIYEDHAYNFIGLDNPAFTRERFSRTVSSRLQFDYFIFDPANLTGLNVWPAGPRLDAVTGANPDGLLLAEQKYLYANLIDEVDSLSDNQGGGAVTPDQTTPSYSDYVGFLNNGAEIIAVGSILRPWLGNIYERRTRFVRAQ